MKPAPNGAVKNFVDEIGWIYRRLRGRIRLLLWAIRTWYPDVARFAFLPGGSAATTSILMRIGATNSLPTLPEEQSGSTSLADPRANEALALAEFAAGLLQLKSTPPTLTLESTSWCNLRCVMCPHAINGVHRPKHMEPELAQSIERFIRQSRSVQLHGIGEPLASRAFWYNLSLLSNDCHSEVNTNFTLLDDQKIKELVGSKLKVVNVSLDAARSDTYRKIRGYALEKVIGNIRKFIAERGARGQEFPRLHMNMTLMRTNIEEVTEFIDLAASLGADAVFFGHLNRWSERLMRRYLIDRDGWIFDYSKEGLWNFSALSNEYLRKAGQLARDKNIPLHFDGNKQVFFDEEAASDV